MANATNAPSESSSMADRVVLVTGASAGMGLVTARALAGLGAKVLLGVRSLERGEAARTAIAQAVPGAKTALVQMDLASLKSVRDAAARVRADHPKLDVLVNNAGGWWHDRRVSPDGIELQWATNVLGPHLLTQLLLPSLEASGRGRVVNVASTAAGGLDFDDIDFAKRKYNGIKAYSATKQANRMLTWGLASRLKGKPVVANALSPGLVKTELNREANGFFSFFFFLMRPITRTPEKGADTAIWLASSSEVEGKSGDFYVDRKVKECKFRDAAAVERLWQVCEQQMSGERAQLRSAS